ncbi:hypothetical protein DMUE_4646 [Dictyocoela muelleri]|nr:hypothetical protein DMUE_4646 [Dictyocoela muelleri]
MYSIFCALNKWRPLISSSKIKIFTDNKNILGKSNNFYKKSNRCKASILDLEIYFENIPGMKNTISDDLSRKGVIKIIFISEKSKNSGSYYYRPLSLEKYFKEFHILYENPGYLPTYLTIKRKHPNLPKKYNVILKDMIKNCHYCQVSKINKHI